MALAYLLDPNQQLFTRGGVLNVGGLIKVYLNGTDDPAVTYSDFEGTANPFPVVLDSNGRAVVIADESMAYRVEVYGADGDLLWTSSPVVPRTYTQNDFTKADKEKLDGIEEGAQKNVKSDWNATSGDAEILNKPNLGDYAEKSELAEVAFTGDYDDLENRPTIPAPQVQADYAQGSPSAVDYIKNKPNLSPVATSGSYNDLSDTPNIPPAQVNSDWNANAGVSEILNKPDIPGMAQTTADALCELKANIEAVEADIPPAQVQADYAQSDPNAVDFIRNKPDLSLKEDKSNKATDTIDPTSTTEYPSSKAMANYTDTAIATNSGKYISDNGSPFTSAGDLPTDSSVSNNDYAVVLTGGIYYRYKATVIGSAVSWAMEYAINTNAFTPAQQAAIDSTITAVKVGNYDAHLANTTVHVTQTNKDTWNAKQNAISDLGTIRSGAQAGSTAVQPPTLAEKAEVTAAALCELKENVQGVEGDIPDVTVYAKIADLAAVAFSGDYDDLIDKPDLSVFARSADLANVATTGSYSDLLDKPDLSVFALSSSLSTVATSGSYSDLTDKPTIPPALPSLSGNDGKILAVKSGGLETEWIDKQFKKISTSYTFNEVHHLYFDEGVIPVLDVPYGSEHYYFWPATLANTYCDFIGIDTYFADSKHWRRYYIANGGSWQVFKFNELPDYALADAYKTLVVNRLGSGVEWVQNSSYISWETEWTSGYTQNHEVTQADVNAGYFDMYQSFAAGANTSDTILDPILAFMTWDAQCAAGITSNYISSIEFAIGVDGGSYRSMFTDNAPAHEVHNDWYLYPNYLLHHRCNRIRIRVNLTSSAVVGTFFVINASGLVEQVRT